MNQLQMMFIVFFLGVTFVFMILNFWTKGFVFQYLRARGKRDKGQIMMVNSRSDVYFRVGELDGEWVVYTDRNKNHKRIHVSSSAPRYIWGKPVWEVDEEKNALIGPILKKGLFGKSKELNIDIKDPNAVTSPNLYIRTWETVDGHDAVKTDHLYKRVLMAPQIQNKKELLIIILLCVCIGGILYLGYKMHGMEKILKFIATNIANTAIETV